jgi:hypothetical protein
MSDTSKCHVAHSLARSQGPAAAFAAPTDATGGVDISLQVGAQRGWIDDGYLALKRGPKRAMLFLSSDAVTAVTAGQIYYYVPLLAADGGPRWFSIGQIYNTGAASLTATAGAAVAFDIPAAATRLAFVGTLSAGNVRATFVPVWDEI